MTTNFDQPDSFSLVKMTQKHNAPVEMQFIKRSLQLASMILEPGMSSEHANCCCDVMSCPPSSGSYSHNVTTDNCWKQYTHPLCPIVSVATTSHQQNKMGLELGQIIQVGNFSRSLFVHSKSCCRLVHYLHFLFCSKLLIVFGNGIEKIWYDHCWHPR